MGGQVGPAPVRASVAEPRPLLASGSGVSRARKVVESRDKDWRVQQVRIMAGGVASVCEVRLRSYGPLKVFPFKRMGSGGESVSWQNAVCRKHLGARFMSFGVYLYPLWSVFFVKVACLIPRAERRLWMCEK